MEMVNGATMSHSINTNVNIPSVLIFSFFKRVMKFSKCLWQDEPCNELKLGNRVGEIMTNQTGIQAKAGRALPPSQVSCSNQLSYLAPVFKLDCKKQLLTILQLLCILKILSYSALKKCYISITISCIVVYTFSHKRNFGKSWFTWTDKGEDPCWSVQCLRWPEWGETTSEQWKYDNQWTHPRVPGLQ